MNPFHIKYFTFLFAWDWGLRFFFCLCLRNILYFCYKRALLKEDEGRGSLLDLSASMNRGHPNMVDSLLFFHFVEWAANLICFLFIPLRFLFFTASLYYFIPTLACFMYVALNLCHVLFTHFNLGLSCIVLYFNFRHVFACFNFSLFYALILIVIY